MKSPDLAIALPEHFGPNAWQKVWRFDNGYGASVVKHSFSYGTELAVVRFVSQDNMDFKLCYDTPITNDVLGDLTPQKVISVLEQIEALPRPTA